MQNLAQPNGISARIEEESKSRCPVIVIFRFSARAGEMIEYQLLTRRFSLPRPVFFFSCHEIWKFFLKRRLPILLVLNICRSFWG